MRTTLSFLACSALAGCFSGSSSETGDTNAARAQDTSAAAEAAPKRKVVRRAPPPAWPAAGAPLHAPEIQEPGAGFTRVRVYLDAGHGAHGNPGNTSVDCLVEEDFTLQLAEEMAEILEETGHFDVRISRAGDEDVDYGKRLADAAEWGADVFLSLHSDIRDGLDAADKAAECPLPREGLSGFTVLWSDEPSTAGGAELVKERKALARSIASEMEGAGFAPYHGSTYIGTYAPDADQAGVFVDRHRPKDRIRVLRRPVMPSVIIETYHAWDREESDRWAEPETRETFALAVAAALIEM